MTQRVKKVFQRSSAETTAGALITATIFGMCYLQIYYSGEKTKVEAGGAFTIGGLKAVCAKLLGASIENFGQWLSGVAGALAFVWLIVAYLQQGRELRVLSEETEALVAANADQQHAMSIQLFLARLSVEASAAAAFVGLIARRAWAGKMEEYLSGVGGGSRDLHFVLFAAIIDHRDLSDVLDESTCTRLVAMCIEFELILEQLEQLERTRRNQLEATQGNRWQHQELPPEAVRDSVEYSAWALAYWTACRVLKRECKLRRKVSENEVRLILK